MFASEILKVGVKSESWMKINPLPIMNGFSRVELEDASSGSPENLRMKYGSRVIIF
jgi:hypothetical protein